MLVGRKKELEILNELFLSNSSELLAVYGRRRVGKTFLIREAYQKHMVFELTGLYNGMVKDQLQNFYTRLKLSSKKFEDTKIPVDWFSAFQLLENYINGLKSKKKKVIFIDEFPWIATARSKFLMAFENFWNTYCTKRDDLLVVVCGSAASFMVNKIIKNKGGLHNRLSQKIRLMPFSLNEMKQFLLSRNIKFTHYDILQLYMVFGGVPHYLNYIKKGESVAQNIDRLCFDYNGALADEYREVFQSLFSNSDVHTQIVKALSKVKRGVTRKKILEICSLNSGGVFSKSLNELIESGFVTHYQPYKKRNKGALFSLTDEYSLFYLKFIEPLKGQGAGTWLKLFSKQSYKVWSGLVFENICLKHIGQIKDELGIAKIFSRHASWHNNHAQIDLLIDRDDGIINLCEIKFHKNEFKITKPEYENIKNMITQFQQSTKSRKNIYLTMITAFGLKENAYSLEIVENELRIDCLFK